MPYMSVTAETFQAPRCRLKEVAPENSRVMSVTAETSQKFRCRLKESAPENIRDMSVTEETFHDDMSPLKEAASRNIPDMSVTRERSGTSVASYTMLEAPLKADSMVVHGVSPHWSIDASLAASGWPSSEMASRPP